MADTPITVPQGNLNFSSFAPALLQIFPTDLTIDWGLKKSVKPRSLNAPFGDGYTQRSGDGINTQIPTYDVTMSNMPSSEADTVESLFELLDGYKSFQWTPPGGSAGTYVCTDWARTWVDINTATMQAKFVEVYN